MRLSEFRQALSDEFGEGYGRVLTRDLILTPFGCTADQALAGGASARDVWLALCAETDVPKARWYGAGLPAARS
ncbi:DUF3046 domain-containing protein [Cryobacterium sp. TMT1-62]|uniref:DUF3046 domain-containing protein n=1 Tax=Cryobacterium sandaracinum TaxID=1259247 RepID=A0ABY2J679_9MICO|nr:MULTISPECIES: DUF3046 domain-containing protein [Cryobacterium]TFB55693.1 DUF3046 domain-containing protein [Cryobacterium sp. Sr3]TFB61568.1 DUF3046 domain-containing protein [Cryobacterium sp. Hz7]TFC35661.1 DUF3046 domain-containing protein [Cryobacterium sp. TMT2-14]TFC47626.1 DUF3046 domain-containing protein [Cryobacterium sp. TMT2-17-1]TFC64826.1 DUF3046 domain-containing protein [Cryobacterium sp. TMT2-4]